MYICNALQRSSTIVNTYINALYKNSTIVNALQRSSIIVNAHLNALQKSNTIVNACFNAF